MREKWVLATIAFLIPAVYRLVLEIYAGAFPLGFDTIAYYIPTIMGFKGLSLLQLVGESPLYYLLLIGVYKIIGNSLIAVKIFSVIMPGILGLSTYLWLRTMSKNPKVALVVALLAMFYFSTLRVTLDLHRNILGISFMFLTLWLVDRNSKFALLTGALTALSHLLEPPILVLLLLFSVRKKSVSLPTIIVTGLVFLTILFLRVQGNIVDNPQGIFLTFSESPYPIGMKAISLFAYLSLPLLPFLVIAIHENIKNTKYRQLISAFLLCLVLSLLPGIISMRYAIIASMLAAILTVFWSLNRNKSIFMFLLAVILILATGYTTMAPTNPFIYFRKPVMWDNSFLWIMTTSMQQNTIPLNQIENMKNVLDVAKNLEDNNKFLIHRNILGYSLVEDLPKDKIIIIEETTDFPLDQAKEISNSGFDVYTIWWVPGKGWYGIQTLPSEFNVVYASGDIALYTFEKNETFDSI